MSKTRYLNQKELDSIEEGVVSTIVDNEVAKEMFQN